MLDKQKIFSPLPWYQNGLNFKCTGCGKCCTGSPGAVHVTDQEIKSISNFLNLTIDVFKRVYLRIRDNQHLLTERKKTYDCIFLKDNKCSIYEVRPQQCRTYPWWIENLTSEQSWQEEAKRCEGINLNASIVTYEEIKSQLSE